ncbi:hypothetical protein HGRIS_008510 [Hohenbuehelia grisea]|uniref:25S rRNA (uridine-N(3))-methyltransferase BMT5-like domain-containing protein n=1 Tax=Hohenbuehelia grisea TaxID=104357 RepID=A0ABR3J885_9AGAR
MAKSSSKGLKAALKSQQSRFKNKEKQAHAVQAAEQRSKKGGGARKQKPDASVDAGPSGSQPTDKGKGKGKSSAGAVQRTARPVIPFRATDKILLIGEGNFSFAHALVYDPPSGHSLEHLPPVNVTATAYDSERECYLKYPEAEAIVQRLRERGVEVLFGVDGTKLERVSALKGRKWDRILWNFPHAGKGIADQDRNILSNQVLVLGFLRSASHMLAPGPVPSIISSRKKKQASDDEDEDMSDGNRDEDEEDAAPINVQKTRGTVLITLRNVSPYTLWDVPRLAKNPPPPASMSLPPNPRYTQLRSFAFLRKMWKGYEHRMTKGERAGGVGTTGEGGEDRTWEFFLRPRDKP